MEQTTRKWKTETELWEIANKISNQIWTSTAGVRETTPSEKAVILNIAFGALLGLNFGTNNRTSSLVERAIVDTAEYTINQFLPDCNGYQTIYVPLKSILDKWERYKD